MCQLHGGGKYIPCQPVLYGGLAFFKKRGKKSGGEQESTGSFLLGKSVSDGVWCLQNGSSRLVKNIKIIWSFYYPVTIHENSFCLCSELAWGGCSGLLNLFKLIANFSKMGVRNCQNFHIGPVPSSLFYP